MVLILQQINGENVCLENKQKTNLLMHEKLERKVF
jgi:hypothetical protein